MPEQIAGLLDLPSVTFAKHIEVADGKVKVQRQTEQGYDDVEAPMPAVVSVTAGVVEPRYPSFKGIMAAKSKPVDEVSVSDLGIDAGQVGWAGAQQEITDVSAAPSGRPARPHAGCRQRLAAEVPVVGTAVVEGERAGGSASTTVNTKIGTRRPLAEKVLLRALGRPKPW